MTRVLYSTLATAIRAADLDPSNTTVWSASGSSTAFAGPCAWSPDGGAVWVYGGSGGGGYYGAGGTARRYDAAGAFQFNYASISWAPNCVAYHSSGDLIAGAGSTIYRFESTSGTITATYTATIGTGGGVRRLWVVGDVVYYYTDGVGGGQLGATRLTLQNTPGETRRLTFKDLTWAPRIRVPMLIAADSIVTFEGVRWIMEEVASRTFEVIASSTAMVTMRGCVIDDSLGRTGGPPKLVALQGPSTLDWGDTLVITPRSEWWTKAPISKVVGAPTVRRP